MAIEQPFIVPREEYFALLRGYHPAPVDILHGLHKAGVDISHDQWVSAMDHAKKAKETIHVRR